MSDNCIQFATFAALAGEGEADPDENAWDERLKKGAKQKPAPEKVD